MRMLLNAAIAATVGAIVGAAAWADDVADGEAIAERWCASCHVVSDAQSEGADGAPAFPELARNMGEDDAWLQAWLADPHPPMPNPELSRSEIDAVIAYLESLRQ